MSYYKRLIVIHPFHIPYKHLGSRKALYSLQKQLMEDDCHSEPSKSHLMVIIKSGMKCKCEPLGPNIVLVSSIIVLEA
jgi:hypothetical protein